MELNDQKEHFQENQGEDFDKLRGVDDKALADIAREFRAFKIEDRLEKMRGLPSKFETREEFEKDWTNARGNRPVPSGLEGFTDERVMESAKISNEKLHIVETVNLHERLHQASDPDFKSEQQRALKEGITQALTDKIMGTKNVPFFDEKGTLHQFYPEETKLAEDLMAKAGPGAVEKLYVRNDASELKKALGGDAEYEARMEQFKKLDEVDLKRSQG